jgi:RNA recognition motif-containing protein
MIRNPITGNTLAADEASKLSLMNTKLYVGNLSFNTNEDALRTAFGQFGTITDVYIANDRETGRPRGFAFVTFGTPEESQAAIEKMNGVELDGRALTVNEAKPKESMGGGGGGGGGRGFSSPNRQAGAFNSRRY